MSPNLLPTLLWLVRVFSTCIYLFVWVGMFVMCLLVFLYFFLIYWCFFRIVWWPGTKEPGWVPRHPFFFNDTATTDIYTLSLHDALPISFFNYDHPNPRIPFWEVDFLFGNSQFPMPNSLNLAM